MWEGANPGFDIIPGDKNLNLGFGERLEKLAGGGVSPPPPPPRLVFLEKTLPDGSVALVVGYTRECSKPGSVGMIRQL